MPPAPKRPVGLAVFTESHTVPRALSAVRFAAVLVLAAAIPFVLGVPDGRRLVWAGVIAALPLLWLVGGYHLWRRICPLAVIGQLGRLVGVPGKRRVTGWLAGHALVVQLGVMVLALAARLVFANGTPLGMVALFAAVASLAALTSFVFTGKTWCTFFCPIGVVERIYAEPVRLAGPASSACTPCTACTKACPDIDLEQGYWKQLASRGRTLAWFAWPGVVLAFYAYYRLHAGDWAFYFSGAWTREADQARGWLGPGFAAWPALPAVLAAPLTLVGGGALSAVLFAAGERLAAARARRRGEDAAELGVRVRHRAGALAGFVGFVAFYGFAGRPLLASLPPVVGVLVTIATAAAATAVLLRRWVRREVDFVEEKVAAKLLARWEWGAKPSGHDLREVVLLHGERKQQQDERRAAYRAAVRELVADGMVTRAELALIDGLRGRLGVSPRDHAAIVAELDEDERRLFDSLHRGELEARRARQRYHEELGRAALVAARLGQVASPEGLGPIARSHAVPAAEHAAAVAALVGGDGPIAQVVRDECAAVAELGRALAIGRGRPAGSRSWELFDHLGVRRLEERAAAIATLVAALADDARPAAEAALAAARVVPAPIAVDDDGVRAALAPLAADASPYLRAVVVRLLGRLGGDAARARAIAACDDPDPLVRETARKIVGLPAGAIDGSVDLRARLETLTTLERMMLVRAVPLFAALPAEALEDVAEAASERRLGDGEVLCREGELGDEVYFLVDGEVEAIAGGRALGVIGAGGSVGELAALDPAPRSATVTARGAVRALALGGGVLDRLLGERPALARLLAQELARRLRAVNPR
jgi:hypothetical protein